MVGLGCLFLADYWFSVCGLYLFCYVFLFGFFNAEIVYRVGFGGVLV
jgi:hypothetical protein